MEGIILKAISGFYYVDGGDGVLVACRGRGKFRHQRIIPLVGDKVIFTDMDGVVTHYQVVALDILQPTAVEEMTADAIIVATGSVNAQPPIPGLKETRHIEATWLLTHPEELADTDRRIVVVGGGSVGCEVADYLAPLVNDLARGNRDVTLVEMGPTLDPTEGAAGRAALVTRMLEKGVHVLTEARVTGVTQDSISYEKDGEEHVIEGVDTMVLAPG